MKQEFLNFAAMIMEDVYNNIMNVIQREMKENEIGWCFIDYGKFYLWAYKATLDKFGKTIDKKVFDDYMIVKLDGDKRVYIEETLELPENESDIENYKVIVYWNCVGELYMEYEHTYIARYVKSRLITPYQKNPKSNFYNIVYSRDGKLVDPTLKTLIHFAGYDEAGIEHMIEIMKIVAKRYNLKLDVVPEYMVYSRSENEDPVYILVEE